MTPDERHWDYICLTVLTIETAALAAAFLIPGTSGDKTTGLDGSPHCSREVACQHGVWGCRPQGASMTLVAPQDPDDTERVRWKREGTAGVVGLLWIMAFIISFPAFTSTALPTLQELAKEIQEQTQEETAPQDAGSATGEEGPPPEQPGAGPTTPTGEPPAGADPETNGARGGPSETPPEDGRAPQPTNDTQEDG